MDVPVKLPPFKAPKVAAVEYEAPQLLPLPELLDEEVPGKHAWQHDFVHAQRNDAQCSRLYRHDAETHSLCLEHL